MKAWSVAGAQFAIASSLLIAAAARPAPPDRVVLQSDSLQLTFTRDGRLAGFTPVRYNDNYLKAAHQLPPPIAVSIGSPDGSG